MRFFSLTGCFLLAAMAVLFPTFSNGQSPKPVSEQQRQAYEAFLAGHPYRNRPRMNKEQLKTIAKKDRPDLAWEQDFLRTLDPNLGYPPKERLFGLFGAMEQAQQNQTPVVPGSGAAPWQERGPNNVGGRTRAIMYDPNDPTDKKVFAGGVTGGLWYTNDITSSTPNWQAVNNFWDNIAVTCLAYDPTNPLVMYAGTGEGWGAAASRGAGIWKSTDGGNNWSQLSATTGFYYVNDIVVRDESGNGVVYAGTSRMFYQGAFHGSDELFRSTNGGTSFTGVMPNGYAAADIEIAADNRIWVGTRRNSSGNGGGRVYFSDNGTTWSLSHSVSGGARVEVACAPSDANYVYCLVESSSELEGVYRSTNRGSGWSRRSEPNDADPGIPSTDFTRSQGWYDLIIQVDPNNRDRVWAGGIDVFRSTDGAANWSQMTHWYGGFGFPEIHADQHMITFAPGSSTEILFGTDGGVYRTSNGTNSSPSFQNQNDDYNVTQFYGCAIHPTANTNYFLAGAQDNGSLKFSSPGVNSTVEVTGGDGGFCFIDQTNPQYQFTSYVYNSWRRSTNGGASFSDIQNDQNTGDFINPGDYDDVQDVLYSARTSSSIQRIRNATGTVNIGSVSISLGSMASAFTVSPYTTSSTTLFIGTEGGRLFRMTNADGTASSTEITGGSFPTGAISSIEIGASENELLVTFFNYGVTSVWYSSNGGTSWVSKEGDLPDMPVRWGMFNPNDRNEVILATEVGVWATTNISVSSPSWTASNSGLANVRVDMLQRRDSDDEVIAATHGRGLFSSSAFSSLLPTANFSGSPTSGCTAPLTVNFNDLSSGTPTSWNWTFGDGGSSTQQNPSHTYTASGVYDVTLIVSNSNGADTLTQTNYIDVGQGQPLPVAEDFENLPFPGTGWEIFNPDADETWERSTGASGFGTGTAALIFDNFNNDTRGTVDEYRTPKLDFSSAGNYQLTFDVAYARYNAANADTLNVLVSTNCGVSWANIYSKGSSTLATAPDDINQFVPSSTEWRTETVSLSAYAGSGLVQIAFANGADFGNVIWVDNINIAVTNAPPTANFNGSPASICPGQNVSFTDASTGTPTGWQWSFPGGTPATSTAQNPTVSYSAQGTYDVQLIVSNANGSDTLTRTSYITVNDCSPTADFTENTTTGCPTLSVNFSDNSTGTPTSWQWSFPGGTPATSTAQNPSVDYSTPGTYDVQLIAINAFGSDTLTRTNHITVQNCSPVAAFSASDSAGCPGLSVTFTDNSTNSPTSWQWSFPGGTPTTSTAQNPTVVYNTNGSFDVTLIATNASGSDTLTKTTFINIGGGNALPIVEDFENLPFPGAGWSIFNPDADATWFRTTSASGFGTGTASMVFDNFNNDVRGTIDEYRTPLADLSNPGIYRLTFDVAYARYDAANADTLSIQVSTDCGVTWTEVYRKDPAVLATAADQTTLFIPTSTNWRKDSVDLSSFAGNSAVQIAFRNGADFGQGLFLDNINILADNNPPIASFTADPVDPCPGQTVQFTDASISATGWQWSFPGGTPATSTAQNPTVSYAALGSYDVTLIVTNPFGSDTLTETAYINVSNGQALPLAEDFESLPFPGSNWSIENPDGDGTWQRTTSVSGFGTGTASMVFDNYNFDERGTIDEYKTPKLNFSSTGTYWLHFDVAYARYDAVNADTLSIQVTSDCGSTWTEVYRKGSNVLATAPDTILAFVPTGTEWRTDSVDLSAFGGNGNVQIAFRNGPDFGQLLYIDNINVNAATVSPPTTAFTANDTTICEGDTVQFTDQSTGATAWSWSFPGGNPATSTAQNPSVVYNSAGNYNVTLTTTNAGGSDPLTKSNYISVSGLPTTSSISGNNQVCANETGVGYSVTNTAGSSYSWNVSGGTIASGGSSNSITVDWSGAGTGTVSVTETNAGGCVGSPVSLPVNINALPSTGSITGDTTVCANENGVSYTVPNTSGSSYSWTITGGTQASGGNTNSITVDWGAGGSGTVSVVETSSASCSGIPVSISVSIDPGPSTGAITGDTAVCANENGVAYSVPNTAGSSYSWTISGGTQASGGSTNSITVDWGAAGSGSVSIVETSAAGCPGTPVSQNISISNSPSTSAISGNSTVCENAVGEVYAVTNTSGSSYSWSITGGIQASGGTSNSITVDWGSSGSGTVEVTETNSSGCPGTPVSVSVTINPGPTTGSITGSAIVCETQAGVGYSVPNTSGSSYTWTITGGTQASGGTSNAITVDWGLAGSGSVEVVETGANGCPGSTVVLPVTIGAGPSTSAISGDTSVCANQTGLVYSVTNTPTSFYTWNITGGTQVSGGSTNSIVVDWGPGPTGTVEIQEIPVSGCPGAPVTLNVSMDAGPSTSALTGPTRLCENSTSISYSVTNNSGNTYNWVITGGVQASGGTTNSITVDWGPSGSGSVQVTEVSPGGCAGTPVSVGVILDPQPGAQAINGDTLVCAGDAGIAYSVPGFTGSSFNWTIVGGTQASGGSTSSITVDWGPAGSGSISVQESTPGGCMGPVNTVSVSVSGTPATGTISGNATACTGETGVTYSVPNTAGSSYSWNITGGTQASGGNSNSITVDWGAVAGTGVIEVTETNLAGCPGSPVTLNVTLSNSANTSAITGPANACAGDTNTYSVINTTGSSYNWTITGGTQTGGGTTNSIQVVWGAPGSGSVEVLETASGGCVGSTVSQSVTVNAVPGAVSITGPASVCENETGITYSVPSTAGSSYNWSVSGGSIVTGGTTNLIVVNWGGAGTGSVSVAETNAAGCDGPPANLPVTIASLPNTPPITGPTAVCNGSVYTYSVPNNPGAIYNWVISGGVQASGGTTNSVQVIWNTTGAGTIEVTESLASGCSGTPVSLNVTIEDNPTTPAINGPNQVCENQTETYSVTNTPGSTYNWTINGGTQTNGGSSSQITVDWGLAGSGSVEVFETSLAGCDGNPVFLNVTINSTPVASFTGPTTVDITLGGVASFTDNSTGATSWQWFFGDGGGSNAQNPSHTYSSTGTFTVTLIATNGGCSDTTTQTITVIQSIGIEDAFEAGTISMYPNPTEGELYLNIDLNRAYDLKIEVYDLLGVKVVEASEQQFAGGTLRYDLSGRTAGVYFVEVRGEGKVWTGKVVLVR